MDLMVSLWITNKSFKMLILKYWSEWWFKFVNLLLLRITNYLQHVASNYILCIYKHIAFILIVYVIFIVQGTFAEALEFAYYNLGE